MAHSDVVVTKLAWCPDKDLVFKMESDNPKHLFTRGDPKKKQENDEYWTQFLLKYCDRSNVDYWQLHIKYFQKSDRKFLFDIFLGEPKAFIVQVLKKLTSMEVRHNLDVNELLLGRRWPIAIRQVAVYKSDLYDNVRDTLITASRSVMYGNYPQDQQIKQYVAMYKQKRKDSDTLLQNVLYRVDACDLNYIPPTTNASEFANWICTERRTGKLIVCPEFTLLMLGFNGFAPQPSNNDEKFDNDPLKDNVSAKFANNPPLPGLACIWSTENEEIKSNIANNELIQKYIEEEKKNVKCFSILAQKIKTFDV
jgi:hypothetical protein